MSLVRERAAFNGNRFPRVSGDEPPPMPTAAAIAAFSPRERG